MQIINRKKFAIIILDLKENFFVIYIFLLSIENIDIYLIKIVQIAYLFTDKVPANILDMYTNNIDIFSSKVVTKFLKYTKINNHFIDLEKNKQPSYRLIYSLESIELETLKIYIKINLKTSFI